MKGRAHLLPWLALLTIYVVWGSTYLAIRVAVQEVPPFAAAAARFAIAGLAMAAIAAWADRGKGLPTRRQLLDYSVIGMLFLGFGNGLVMWSEQRIPSGIAALLVATVPLWITLLDGLRPGGQPWTLRVWVGTLVGLLGVYLVARPEGGAWAGHLTGIVALQVATVSWTMGTLYSKVVRNPLPVMSAAAVEMLAGAVVLFGESLALREPIAAFAGASSQAYWALAYLVVFGSLIGFTAFSYCLTVFSAGTVGTYAYVNPVVAVVLGALLLGEPVTAGLLLGGALILGAVVLTTTALRASPAPARDAQPELSEAAG
ncbi:MAG TPA: EamA family transporter [Vicinamibacteria bacterium]|nr:EamA family transporter [Vicinamibacteria bacterium]